MTLPRPMVTPPQTVTFPPSQHSSSMVIGFAYSRSYRLPSGFSRRFRSRASSGCMGVSREQPVPIITFFPMVTGQQSSTLRSALMNVLSPITVKLP